MFTPHIFVFESNHSDKVLSMFEQKKFNPFYDAKHSRDYHWFLNNIRTEHRLYSFSDKGIYDYQIEDFILDRQISKKPSIYRNLPDTRGLS